MNNPLLAIQIPYTEERQNDFDSLFKRLNSLIESICGGGEAVIIMSDPTGKHMTIGEKREKLYKDSTALYTWQLDSDDDISDNAISLILEAIEQQNPDCITFEEYINKDGIEYSSNHSLTYGGWHGDWDKKMPDGFNFWRTPFFKSVIKTEIAKSVPVPHIRFGEDHEWSIALLPHLKSEVHIPEQLYRYIHISSDSTERYGFDK